MSTVIDKIKNGELFVEVYSTKQLQLLNAVLTKKPLKVVNAKSIVAFENGEIVLKRENEVDFDNLIDFFELDIDEEVNKLSMLSPKEQFQLGLVSTIVGTEENLETLGLKLRVPSNTLIDTYSELLSVTPVYFFNGELNFDILGNYSTQVSFKDLVK